jgi:hypothetical protein
LAGLSSSPVTRPPAPTRLARRSIIPLGLHPRSIALHPGPAPTRSRNAALCGRSSSDWRRSRSRSAGLLPARKPEPGAAQRPHHYRAWAWRDGTPATASYAASRSTARPKPDSQAQAEPSPDKADDVGHRHGRGCRAHGDGDAGALANRCAAGRVLDHHVAIVRAVAVAGGRGHHRQPAPFSVLVALFWVFPMTSGTATWLPVPLRGPVLVPVLFGGGAGEPGPLSPAAPAIATARRRAPARSGLQAQPVR